MASRSSPNVHLTPSFIFVKTLYRRDVCGCGNANPKCKQDRDQCWNPGDPPVPDDCGGRPNPPPPSPTPPAPSPVVTPTNPAPAPAPSGLRDRKVRQPGNDKTGLRLGKDRRGGAAGGNPIGGRSRSLVTIRGATATTSPKREEDRPIDLD